MQEIPKTQPINGESEPQDAQKKHIPEQIEAISESIAEKYNEFKESEHYEELKNKATQVSDYIHENPVRSVAYALGAGVLLGLLLHRKK